MESQPLLDYATAAQILREVLRLDATALREDYPELLPSHLRPSPRPSPSDSGNDSNDIEQQRRDEDAEAELQGWIDDLRVKKLRQLCDWSDEVAQELRQAEQSYAAGGRREDQQPYRCSTGGM